MLDISKYSDLTDKNDYIAYEYACIMKKQFLIFTSIVFLFSGCIQRSVRSALYDVESYIMDRPDSALAVLESMDMDQIKSKRDIAHHALLHAMALDKNYIDVDDDSLARIAVDYFSRKGPKKYEARALYYLGVAYYYKGDFNKAILEFTKAENVSKLCDSLYWGMTMIKQADTYGRTHNNIEKINCLQQAYNIYDAQNIEYYRDVSLLYLAEALFNIGKENIAEDILVDLIDEDNIDSKIKITALVNCAFLKANPNIADFDGAVKIYEDIFKYYDSSYMTYKDFWAMSYSYTKDGKIDYVQNLINELRETDTTGTSFYWQYLIAKSDQDYKSALNFLEIATDKIDKEIAEALQQSLALTQRDYYIAQSEIAEYKVRNKNLVIIASISLALLFICLILWILLKRIRHQQEEKEKYLQYANEIRLQLEASKKDDYPALKKKYVELYKSKFEMIGSLYEQYSLSFGKKNAEHSIYEKVAGIVKSFSNDYINSKLMEEMLDEGLDGIMTNIRNEVSDLQEKDYMVFRLMAVGFDVTTISHLMNVTMNSVYIRKSRIKSRIEASSPEHKNQFLSILA